MSEKTPNQANSERFNSRIISLSELPAEPAKPLGKEEAVRIAAPPDFDPSRVRKFWDFNNATEIAGVPLATIRAGGKEPGTHVDYLLVDMRGLPVNKLLDNPLGKSLLGRNVLERELPDGGAVNGDIAVLRPRDNGNGDYEITRFAQTLDTAEFGRHKQYGADVSLKDEEPAEDIPGQVSRNHFWVRYDNTNGDITIANRNPSNETWVFAADPNSGDQVNWKPEVEHRAVEQHLAHLALRQLVIPEDLKR